MIPESLKPALFAATDLLRDYNILTPPVNISKIFAWLWLALYEIPFPWELDHLSWMLDIENKSVYINENDEDYNKSFTAAHELWHWILHKKFLEVEPEKYLFVFKKRWKIDTDDQLEREANCFAKNLIVPKFMLDTLRTKFSIIELAKIFWTSPLVIEKRISQEYYEI